MANLRDLLFGYEGGTAITPGEFTVLNTNYESIGNGGCCLLWTVPAGKTRAVFEMWSGGGTGAGGCCCMQGGGAGGGGYAVKAIDVVAGQQIQICAAGSGCCGDYYTSINGCPSWVCSQGGGGAPTWFTCLSGGYTNDRCVTCQLGSNCYTCCTMCSGCGGRVDGGTGQGANQADFVVCGVGGNGHSTQYCHGAFHQFAGNGPMTPGPRIGYPGCYACGAGVSWGIFPGGGGLSSQTYGGGCCCGGPGSGGQVYVLYY